MIMKCVIFIGLLKLQTTIVLYCWNGKAHLLDGKRSSTLPWKRLYLAAKKKSQEEELSCCPNS